MLSARAAANLQVALLAAALLITAVAFPISRQLDFDQPAPNILHRNRQTLLKRLDHGKNCRGVAQLSDST